MDALDFLHRWGADNVQPVPSSKLDAAESLAARCIVDAAQHGISEEDLEVAMGQDLVSYMSDLIDNANFAEVERVTSSTPDE